MPTTATLVSAAAAGAVDRFVGKVERRHITSIPDTTWYRYEQAGLAPRRRQLGPNRIGWLELELRAWVQDRAEGRYIPSQAA